MDAPTLGFEGTLAKLNTTRITQSQDSKGVDTPVVLVFEGRNADMHMTAYGCATPEPQLMSSTQSLLAMGTTVGYAMAGLGHSVSRFSDLYAFWADLDREVALGRAPTIPSGVDRVLIHSAPNRVMLAAAHAAYAFDQELADLQALAKDRYAFESEDAAVAYPVNMVDMFDLAHSVFRELRLMTRRVARLTALFDGAIDSQSIDSAAGHVQAMCTQLQAHKNLVGVRAKPACLMASVAMAIYAVSGFMQFVSTAIQSVLFFEENNPVDDAVIQTPRLVRWFELNDDDDGDYDADKQIGQIMVNSVLSQGEWLLSRDWEEHKAATDASAQKASVQHLTVSGSVGSQVTCKTDKPKAKPSKARPTV